MGKHQKMCFDGCGIVAVCDTSSERVVVVLLVVLVLLVVMIMAVMMSVQAHTSARWSSRAL